MNTSFIDIHNYFNKNINKQLHDQLLYEYLSIRNRAAVAWSRGSP